MSNENNKNIGEILKNIRIERGFNLQETFEDIENYITKCEKSRDEAYSQLAEWNKDVEIQKLKDKNNELIEQLKDKRKGYTSFVVTPEENEEIKTWIEKHINEKHNGDHYAGAIGGRFSYRFIPTSIGEIGEIVCSCGEKFCFRELC